MKTHEGWGVMLPCNPPAHYPGESGPWLDRGPGGPAAQQRRRVRGGKQRPAARPGPSAVMTGPRWAILF